MKNPIIPTDTDFANTVPNSRAFIISGIPIEPSTITSDECRIVKETRSRVILRHTVTTKDWDVAVFYEKAVLSSSPKRYVSSIWKPLAYTGFVFVNPA